MADRSRLPAGRLLALDPSSTACGWAVFDAAGTLKAFGRITPRGRAAQVARIDEIVRRVRGLLECHRPDAVLLEWSEGLVHARLRRTAGGSVPTGLSILGAAQGAVRQMAREAIGPDRVAIIHENIWTRRIPKKERAARLALEFPDYRRFRAEGRDGDPETDLDAADAIGIGLHYFAERREAELLARANHGRT